MRKYYVSANVGGKQRREIISKGFDNRYQAQMFILNKKRDFKKSIQQMKIEVM